jgi:hypothetical protein
MMQHQSQPRLSHHWCQGHRCKKSKSIVLFALAYSKHLGAAGWAYALSCGSAIFHGYFLGVLHFSFGFAFHTISFHLFTSLSFVFVKSLAPPRGMQIRAQDPLSYELTNDKFYTENNAFSNNIKVNPYLWEWPPWYNQKHHKSE